MKLLMLDPRAIADAPKNATVMDPVEYALLVKAVREVGFWDPPLVRADGAGWRMVDGHHRRDAAVEVGLAEVPCIELPPEVSDEQGKALSLGLNRLRGKTDLAAAADVLAELAAAGWPEGGASWAGAGFSDAEAADLLAMAATPPVDELPPALGPEPGDEDEAPKPFVLEVEFPDRETYQKVRRTIRRAAGKGRELWEGLAKLAAAGD